MRALEGTLNTRQLFFIVVLTRIAVMADGLPVITSGDALQDAWLAALLGTAAGVALAALAATLAMRYPGKSLGALAREALGRWLGLAASLAVVLVFVALALFEVTQLAFVTKATILPRTPEWAFLAGVLLTAVYGAYLGADAMGRASEILITVVLGAVAIGVFLVFAAPFPQTLSSLSPVLRRGFRPVVEAGILPAFWFLASGAVVLGLGKSCRPAAGMRRAVSWGVAVSGLLLTLFTITSTLALGPGEAADQLAPLLSVARAVTLPGVVERTDLLLIAVWLLGVVFEVTIFILAAGIILADAFMMKTRHAVLSVGTAAIVTVNAYTPTVLDLRRFVRPLPTGLTALLALAGLIGLILAVGLLRGSGERRVGR